MTADEEHHRESWKMFGNEVEKVELDVIRNQQILRTRVDKMDLRRQVWYLSYRIRFISFSNEIRVRFLHKVVKLRQH